MISKRKSKQRRVERGISLFRTPQPEGKAEPIPETARLIFKEGTAAVAGVWEPGDDGDRPVPPEKQP